jgi:hypothetical protein
MLRNPVAGFVFILSVKSPPAKVQQRSGPSQEVISAQAIHGEECMHVP